MRLCYLSMLFCNAILMLSLFPFIVFCQKQPFPLVSLVSVKYQARNHQLKTESGNKLPTAR